MNNGRINHILLDMDGVIADFVGSAIRLFGREDLLSTWPCGQWCIAKALGISEVDFWGKIDVRGRHFWERLDFYPWAFRLTGMLTSFAPWTICTSPSHHPESLAGKLAWLHSCFGFPFRNYFMGSAKHLFARPGTVLVDDSDKNVSDFQAAGGKSILFPQPWNALYAIQMGEDKLDYVERQLREIASQPCP